MTICDICEESNREILDKITFQIIVDNEKKVIYNKMLDLCDGCIKNILSDGLFDVIKENYV